MTKGKVYLIGAGPGDPGLLTLKGADLLSKADVIVYDRLVSPETIRLASPSAQLVFMGKEPETPGVFQEEINKALVEAAEAGKMVVRLKGGDPFVFGRGSEELLALKDKGILFEVVPGITSAIAAPAYAGVPVTHRGIAAGFTVVTGSEDPEKLNTELDWPALAKNPGTLVVLMGWRSLPSIVRSLIANGKSPKTPVTAIQWGTLPRQKTVTGTLETIIERGTAACISSPVVTVIGKTAEMHGALRWFDTSPLFGKNVLVPRSRNQAGILSSLLREHGANAIELPLIEVLPLASTAELDQAISRLDRFAWVIFTSVNGVDFFFRQLGSAGKDSRAFRDAKIAAVGSSTAKALRLQGLEPDFIPRVYTADSIAKGLCTSPLGGSKILLPRASEAPSLLPELLEQCGAFVEDVPTYQNVIPKGSKELARQLFSDGKLDVATFTSSSTVRNLMELLGNDASKLDSIATVSIGPVTSATIRELGLKVGAEAEEATVQSLVQATIGIQSNGGKP